MEQSPFGWVELVLAVVAIVFASKQFQDAREARGQLNRTHEELRKLQETQSTKYVGCFPKNLRDITEVVLKAERDLDILVDVGTYGHYSNPEGFQRYFQAITSVCNRGVRIRLIYYAQELDDEGYILEFPREEFEDERRSARFKRFFEFYPGLMRPGTWEEMKTVLQDKERRHSAELEDLAVEMRTRTKPFQRSPLSIWVEDGEEAVFSFQNTGPAERDFSFRSRDKTLIDELHKYFGNFWKQLE
jgi:hypothetical protein